MKQPIFKTKADMLEHLCKTITSDDTNPSRFHIIKLKTRSTKRTIVKSWNNVLTLFGHELIKMFLDEYGYIPSPEELKEATTPRLSVVVDNEGMFWEVGVYYIKPQMLAFTPHADYEATVFRVDEKDKEIIVKAIVDREDYK